MREGTESRLDGERKGSGFFFPRHPRPPQMRKTKQYKDLRKYSQLFLDAGEWKDPVPVIERPGEGELVSWESSAPPTEKVVAWIIDRR